MLGEKHLSPHWCITRKLPSNRWKLSRLSMGDERTIKTLNAMSQSGKKSPECLVVKKEPCRDFVEVDMFIFHILHNQINLGNSLFHNLLDYGNECIEKLSVKEETVRNLVIDPSIEEKVKLGEEFNISEEGRELHSIKSIKRRDMTSISTMTDKIFNRDSKIDKLKKKREIFSNDIYSIKRHKFKLNVILKEGRKDSNGAEFGLEDRICTLLQIYHIK